jgi:hypothetical protein
MASHLGWNTRAAMRYLREHLPCPVKVRTVEPWVLEEYHGQATFGDCHWKKGGYWLIRLARGLSDTEMMDALEHEYAHALDEQRHGIASINPHRVTFWLAYKECHEVVRGR